MELRLSQRKHVWDIIEHVVKKIPIPNALMDDAQVVHRLLSLSVEQPQFICDWLRLLPISAWSHLTERDILPEEQMVDLHLAVGFTDYNMVDWLRGLSASSVDFFKEYAQKKMVNGVDQWVFKSRYHPQLIEGIYVSAMPTPEQDIATVITHALKERITIKDYHQVLAHIGPRSENAEAALQQLINDHQVFSPMSSSTDVLRFRIASGLFDYIKDPAPYLKRVGLVIDQLLSSSTIPKALGLLNLLPNTIISHTIQRCIDAPMPNVTAHLNEALPNFEYGAIRKIVRRQRLGLNYKHD
ncbi:MAG: hypothetical protein ISQ13_04680 [Candidatus Margulisbacteria bacterium]|nr:hypothetical protein [Candidatus Margulisiibacteriota bacterium]